MMKCVAWFRRVDRLCAQLNAGLAAVAIALSVVLAIQLTARASILLGDAQAQIAMHGDYTVLTAATN